MFGNELFSDEIIQRYVGATQHLTEGEAPSEPLTINDAERIEAMIAFAASAAFERHLIRRHDFDESLMPLSVNSGVIDAEDRPVVLVAVEGAISGISAFGVCNDLDCTGYLEHVGGSLDYWIRAIIAALSIRHKSIDLQTVIDRTPALQTN